jgi:glycosyltransferase involved in cell wall biosynthesis
MWLDTRLRAGFAKRSIHWADLTIAPSEAFAAELHRWTKADVLSLHHGFDQGAFTRDDSPLAREVEAKLSSAEQSLKVLFVSHYNYYRNFETLIRALPLLRGQQRGRSIKLLLTCSLMAGGNPGGYRTEAASALVKALGVSDIVVELGAIPYRQLHHLYRRADLYVTPAYTETFAHPLVEAMASGLPVIASDLPVHQEICGEAAVYFPRFSAESLAHTVSQIAHSSGKLAAMKRAGLARSGHFSWKAHVDKILEFCHILVNHKPRAA